MLRAHAPPATKQAALALAAAAVDLAGPAWLAGPAAEAQVLYRAAHGCQGQTQSAGGKQRAGLGQLPTRELDEDRCVFENILYAF